MNAPLSAVALSPQQPPQSDEWYQTRDEYIRDALAGRDDDWSRFDLDASASTLAAIHEAAALPADEFKSAVQRLIAARIQSAAEGHATVVERNWGRA